MKHVETLLAGLNWSNILIDTLSVGTSAVRKRTVSRRPAPAAASRVVRGQGGPGIDTI